MVWMEEKIMETTVIFVPVKSRVSILKVDILFSILIYRLLNDMYQEYLFFHLFFHTIQLQSSEESSNENIDEDVFSLDIGPPQQFIQAELNYLVRITIEKQKSVGSSNHIFVVYAS